jgi:hypothetical protein
MPQIQQQGRFASIVSGDGCKTPYTVSADLFAPLPNLWHLTWNRTP